MTAVSSIRRRKVLVTGAGGFIGHHLVSHVKRQGACRWIEAEVAMSLELQEVEHAVA